MRNLTRAMGAAVVLVAAAGGCGLFDDATTFTIDTGWKTVSVDSDALKVTVPSGGTIPSVPCTPSSDPCALAQAGLGCSAQTYGCKVQCGAGGTCEIVANAEIGQTVDISSKVNNQTSATVVSKVSFNYMLYKVTQNTLTFATPQIELFVGPGTAKTTADAGVVAFATVAPIAAGDTPDGQVDATEAGKAALSGFVKDYKNPFKVIARVGMRFAGGDALPQGKLTLEVNGFFKIQP